MGRTNVVLDDALVARCQKATGIKTRRALIDHGWPSAAKPPFDFAQGPEHAERATQKEEENRRCTQMDANAEGNSYFTWVTSSRTLSRTLSTAIYWVPTSSTQKPGSSTFSVVHCGGDVEFTDGEVEHGD